MAPPDQVSQVRPAQLGQLVPLVYPANQVLLDSLDHVV